MLTENWFQITIPALSQWSLLLSFFMVILNHLQKFFVYKIACLNEPHTIFIVCSCNHRKLAQICSSLFYVSKVIWACSSISLLLFHMIHVNDSISIPELYSTRTMANLTLLHSVMIRRDGILHYFGYSEKDKKPFFVYSYFGKIFHMS